MIRHRPAFSPRSCYILRDQDEVAYFTQHGGAPEAQLIDWATQLFGANQCFIDVGAHVGSWTQHLAQSGAMLAPAEISINEQATMTIASEKSARRHVYAFEPQASTYKRLCEGVLLAGLTNVTCNDVALGARGEVDLHIVSVDGGGSTLRHRAELGSELSVERVHGAQLDDYRFVDVGLIKIDAEGAERDILRGAHKTLEVHHRPTLLLEAWLHGWFAQERAALIADVEALGYRVQPVLNWPEMLLATRS